MMQRVSALLSDTTPTQTAGRTSPLSLSPGGLCCAVLHRLLFAIGGCDDKQECLQSVESYNPDKRFRRKFLLLTVKAYDVARNECSDGHPVREHRKGGIAAVHIRSIVRVTSVNADMSE